MPCTLHAGTDSRDFCSGLEMHWVQFYKCYAAHLQKMSLLQLLHGKSLTLARSHVGGSLTLWFIHRKQFLRLYHGVAWLSPAA